MAICFDQLDRTPCFIVSTRPSWRLHRDGLRKAYETIWSLVLIIVGVPIISSASGQEPPAPGSISLLPGYHHRVDRGIDSKVGRIWKEGGLIIHYDIGELAGDYTECGPTCGWTNGELWRREQLVQGQRVICVFTKKRKLVVSFPGAHANFYGTVNTDKQLTEMLLMLLTFKAR